MKWSWFELREYRWNGDVIISVIITINTIAIFSPQKVFGTSMQFEPMASALTLQCLINWSAPYIWVLIAQLVELSGVLTPRPCIWILLKPSETFFFSGQNLQLLNCDSNWDDHISILSVFPQFKSTSLQCQSSSDQGLFEGTDRYYWSTCGHGWLYYTQFKQQRSVGSCVWY